MVGVIVLCEWFVEKIEVLYGVCYDLVIEIMVIVSVSEGFYVVISVFVYLGDEVIYFELLFDSYVLIVWL